MSGLAFFICVIRQILEIIHTVLFLLLQCITIWPIKIIKVGDKQMSHVVTLRLNDEEYCKLKQAVKRTKLPQSEFIRNALVNRVHAVMQVKSIK